MGQFIKTLGDTVAGGLPGAILGIGLAGFNDRRQLNQQADLNELQIGANKRMLDYAQQKQYEMWLKTNYSAQVAEMKKAGINPALLYGMSGGGGTTTGNASGNITGGTAPTGGGEIQGMMGMGMQLQLLKAQKENIEADTEVKRTEAEFKGGVATREAETRILDLTQGIENKRAQKILTEVQTRLSELDENLRTRTLEDQVRAVGWQAEKVMQEMEQARFETNIAEDTWRMKVDQVQATLIETWLRNALLKSQTAKTNVEIKQIANKIVQDWRALEISGQTANTQEQKARHDKWVNDVQASTNLPVDVIEKALQALILKQIMQRPEHTPIRGFGK